jgi:hypothetical protein
MTRAAALAEARRRWGPNAGLNQYGSGVAVGVYARYALVTDPLAQVFGSGKTWECAFADADRRERAT